MILNTHQVPLKCQVQNVEDSDLGLQKLIILSLR